MNKRLRSRVLTLALVGTSVGTIGALTYLPEQEARAQEKPSAQDLLDRAKSLYRQQNYLQTKAVLQDIDPAQLSEASRSEQTELSAKTSQALAASQRAQNDLEAGQAAEINESLAQAAELYQRVIDGPAATESQKEKARQQLALVREKQRNRAPAMKALLKQALAAYDAGRLEEAENALSTIERTGSDLGWFDSSKPAKYRQLIAEKRAAAAPVAAAPVPPAAVAAPVPSAAVAAPVTSAAAPLAAAPDAPVAPTAPTPPAAPASPLMQQVTTETTIQQQRTQTLVDNNLRLSSEALAANDFRSALDRAQDALAILEGAQHYFATADYQNLRQKAQAQIQAIQRQQQSYDEQMRQVRSQNIQKEQQNLADRRRRERSDQVRQLMAQAREAYQTKQYNQAAELFQQVVAIDPQNTDAKFNLQITRERLEYQRFDTFSKRRAEELMKNRVASEEAIIPYHDLLIYPEDWPELTRRRAADPSSNDSPANRKVRERLEQTIAELITDNKSLEKVIDSLRDATNTNIFVNWAALQSGSVDRNTPVTITLRDVPLKKVLSTILSQLGSGGTTPVILGYTIDEGVITISTAEELNRQTVVRTYDIRDLLVQAPSFDKPPSFSLSETTQAGTTGSGGGGGGGAAGGGGQGGGLFGGQGGDNAGSKTIKTREDLVKELRELISTTVSPDTWRESGGTIGSIKEMNGQLVVNQTADNQIKVNNLLQQLREQRALQISIEARFLVVENSFLDDFGFSWNMAIAPPQANLISGQGLQSGIAIANNTSTLAPSAQNFGNGNTSSLAVGSGTGTSNITTVIDNVTLNMLLKATQIDKRSTTLTAPRVTLFNGQRGYIVAAHQVNFVSNFTSQQSAGTVNTGSQATVTLTVSTLSTGVVLDVEATISNDRRYVVMTLQPSLAQLNGITRFNAAGQDASATASTVSPGFVQLPSIDVTTIRTTVSVPDGGTLLIGGQKLVGETEIEAGVPILSKIPGINRLFTNRTFYKEEKTLLILVRPKIIIQREEEQRQFGASLGQ